jgi:hypothetical protein
MITVDQLRDQFGGHVELLEQRPGLYQLFAPLYHEDGDMLEIFLKDTGTGMVRISDCAMTLMRLSYDFEINTENKERVLRRILSENQVLLDDGNLFIDCLPESVYAAIMHFAQVVGKVMNMRLYKRDVIQSLFYELLNEFIESNLQQYRPKPHVLPNPTRDDLEVDWAFDVPSRPVYLFGVRDSSKARLVTISCLQFQLDRLPFRSFVVHEDFESLARKDRLRITSAADKQFPTLGDFQENAVSAFAREVA